ncbi:MAG: methylated-DNA--[protein]-cysteine S-methyltransferase [Acidobacteriales bacterium]|nr:methylated-DNA--[protein]-cysteine S-methyltransferase [Terriglobales bacterium]
MNTVHYTRFDTGSPAGVLTLAATEKGLALLSFHEGVIPEAVPSELKSADWIESPAKLRSYRKQVEDYLAGKRRDFDLPLDLRGPDFHKKCWRALLRIPFGQTRSYAEIARQVGSSAAFRAVGQANHHNPVAIIVPCHRLITTAGTLGGYGGGLPLKKWLLELEGVQLEKQMNLL